MFFILSFCCPQFQWAAAAPGVTPRNDNIQRNDRSSLFFVCCFVFQKQANLSQKTPSTLSSIPCWIWVICLLLKQLLAQTSPAGEPTIMTTMRRYQSFSNCISKINVISSSRYQAFTSLWKSKVYKRIKPLKFHKMDLHFLLMMNCLYHHRCSPCF